MNVVQFTDKLSSVKILCVSSVVSFLFVNSTGFAINLCYLEILSTQNVITAKVLHLAGLFFAAQFETRITNPALYYLDSGTAISLLSCCVRCPKTQHRYTHHRIVPKQNLVHSIKYIFIADKFVVDEKVQVVVVPMIFLSWLNKYLLK